MGVRREPKNNFLGVHWTQWPWPSLFVRAIFRRFVRRPNDAASEYRRSVLFLFAEAEGAKCEYSTKDESLEASQFNCLFMWIHSVDAHSRLFTLLYVRKFSQLFGVCVRSMYHRLSLGYLLICGVTFVTTTVYFFSDKPDEEDSKKVNPNVDLSVRRSALAGELFL
jgi:hypothetical protein